MPVSASLDNINVVLVNTSHPGNIGAAARAMKNMGLRHLTLVAPQDFPSDTARWRAVSAADIVDNARVVDSLPEAIADSVLVMASSARSRSMPWPMLDPRECARQVVREAKGGEQVSLVFGREDTGLSNEELKLCNYHVQIPADPDYSSLNLAAAAMVLLYEVRMAALAGDGGESEEGRQYVDDAWDVPRATAHQMELFYEHLETALVELGFHDPENPRLLMPRMRRLFGRIRPDRMELNILRGILTHIQQSLRR